VSGMAEEEMVQKDRSGVVIIGGGFGGLAVAKSLGGSRHSVTVIDRRNHNLFQPLLYQVATAALSPADISEPIRRTLGKFANIEVRLADVTGVDYENKTVITDGGGVIPYDKLVLATGSAYNYFGNDAWRAHAPGLKTLHEARLVRQRLLMAFEKAEIESNSVEKKALLTTVVVGGGPTGVEMAGATVELGRFMIKRDFRNLRQEDLRVVLIEAGPNLLSSFPVELSDYARAVLERTGVEVMINTSVTSISETEVTTDRGRISMGCAVWGAGVKPSPAAGWLGLEAAAKGLVPVNQYLEVVGRKDIYAIGDTAFLGKEFGGPLPALAQVAKQQGTYLGKLLRDQPAKTRPFRFRNRGNTAVIARNVAVFDFGSWTLRGRLAWALWAAVHVYLLVSFEKKLLVTVQWSWRYLTQQRGARVIDETAAHHVPSSTEPAET
jgi:NADH:ubiquinone reductase (H+-translocating)